MRTFLVALVAIAIVSVPAYAEKLVFKDGTIEEVEYYRVDGEKVIFKSPERGVEKVPLDKVDLKATVKLNEERAQPAKTKGPDTKIYTKEERAALGGKEAMERQRNRLIAPGLVLPDQPGIYLYDGVFKLLTEHRAKIEMDKGRKLLGALGASFVNQKYLSYLPGDKSQVRTTRNNPVLYVDPTLKGNGKFVVYRLKSTHDRREIAEVTLNAKRQVVEKKNDSLSISINELGNGILELHVTQLLTPGEYGLAQLADQNPLDLATVNVEIVIWDFGVDKEE